MDPMTDGDDGPVGEASAPGGAMRVVMLNARTAVLVPADAPDPVAAGDDGDWQDVSDPAADAASGDHDGTHDGAAWASDPGDDDTTALSAQADPDMADPDVTVEPDLSAGDAAMEDPGQASGHGAASAQATASGAESLWRTELLARLDDLGRLLARTSAPVPEPAADATLARLTDALDRMEQRLDTSVAEITARLDDLERLAPAAGHIPAADAQTAEAIADLRMHLRMVEVQVGTLGKLLVSGSGEEATGPDILRTRLAELMAREQRHATGS
ncbi:MAG: hypothetical protein MUF73_02925 [Rhodobacteraceae bacterium]|jgi:hypothetical protein|nr:hypothetical protein [Paracoccaceae bacterium]